MSKLVGLLYLLAGGIALAMLLTFSGCASWHDSTWDIDPIKPSTHIKGHLRPEDKPADKLTLKEIGKLKAKYPEAFLPALPAIDEGPNMSSKPIAPERVWPIYRHQNEEKDRIQLPIIILDIDPEIPTPDGPST